MAIDYNALRRFQEMWGPVMDALPSILEASAKQADIERVLRLTKLDHEKAVKDVGAVYAEADKRLAQMNKELEDIQAEKDRVRAEIEQSRIAYAEEVQKSMKTQQELLHAINTKITVASNRLATVEAEYSVKVEAAEKNVADTIAKLDADVKELEKRKAAAEKALASLRDKLG